MYFQCWDTSGAPQFGAVVNIFEKRTPHKIYIYDTSRPDTFNRDKIPQDALVVANIRENNPPLAHTHTTVRLEDPKSIENLLNILTTTFETEAADISVVNEQPECCVTF